MSNNFGDRYNPRYDFGMMRNNNEVEESTNTNTTTSSSSSSSSTRCKFWDFILGGNYSQLVALLKNDTNDPSYSPGFLNDPIISTELTSSLNFLKKDPILISIFYVFGGFQSSAFLLNNTNQENDESKFFINLSKNYHHHHHHQHQQNEENDLFWLIGVSKSKETINLSKHFSKILQILNRLPHNNNNNINNDSTTKTTTTMVENNKRIRKKRKGINNNDIDNYSNKNSSSSSGWWLQDEMRTALLCMNRCNAYLEGGKTIPNDVILLITDIYLKSYIEQAFHNVVSAIEKNCTAGG